MNIPAQGWTEAPTKKWVRRAFWPAICLAFLALVAYASLRLLEIEKDRVPALVLAWKVLAGISGAFGLIAGFAFQLYLQRTATYWRVEADRKQVAAQQEAARANMPLQTAETESIEKTKATIALSAQLAAERRAKHAQDRPTLVALASAIQADIKSLVELAESSPLLKADRIREMTRSASACQADVIEAHKAVRFALGILPNAFEDLQAMFLNKGFDIISDAGAIRPRDYSAPGLDREAIVARQTMLLSYRMNRHVARLKVLGGLLVAMIEREIDPSKFGSIRLTAEQNIHARALKRLEARHRTIGRTSSPERNA